MKRPQTYLITDGTADDADFGTSLARITNLANTAAINGISYFQIREKRLSAANLYSLTYAIAQIFKNTSTRLLVNDRADIALATGADGVHLTARSMKTSDIRSAFGQKLMVFVSTHTEDDIVSAFERSADAVVFGPIFESPGKGLTVGLDELRRVCNKFSQFEILALGGIDESTFEVALDAGAAGFAGIRLFDTTEKIETISKRLNQI